MGTTAMTRTVTVGQIATALGYDEWDTRELLQTLDKDIGKFVNDPQETVDRAMVEYMAEIMTGTSVGKDLATLLDYTMPKW